LNNYKPTFGVEIHAVLDTKTKAFSPAESVFDAEPNTKVTPVDMGYPGAQDCKDERTRRDVRYPCFDRGKIKIRYKEGIPERGRKVTPR